MVRPPEPRIFFIERVLINNSFSLENIGLFIFSISLVFLRKNRTSSFEYLFLCRRHGLMYLVCSSETCYYFCSFISILWPRFHVTPREDPNIYLYWGSVLSMYKTANSAWMKVSWKVEQTSTRMNEWTGRMKNDNTRVDNIYANKNVLIK